MANGHSEEFRRDAVRIALTRGLTRRQVSADLGVGLSALNKWIKSFDEEAVVSGPDQDLARENERLRRENRILKEERDVLKSHSLLREAKDVRFAFIDPYDGKLRQGQLCKLLEVTDRGYRSWRSRPISQRQRDDMVILAHIREQHRLSLGRYGRPRMTEE